MKVPRQGSDPRVHVLDDRLVFTVGRDPQSAIVVDDASVSRLHATLLRLDRHLVVRDEGSRLGTQVNGHKAKIAFLSHGDRLALGKLELSIDLEHLPAPRVEGPVPIDADAYLILEDRRHPSIATALVRFLETENAPSWIAEHASQLFEDMRRAGEFARMVHRVYAVRAARARELVSELLGERPDNLAALRSLLASRVSELGPQVIPAGWFARI